MNEDISSRQSCVPAIDKDTIFVCPWCMGVSETAKNEPITCVNCGNEVTQDDLTNAELQSLQKG